MKRRLYMVPTGNSVSVDSQGDIHFFNCWFSALQEPPERCGGWDRAEKYPYRVYYKQEDGKGLYSDIQKLVCPSDCEGDCQMEQWGKNQSFWDVQQACERHKNIMAKRRVDQLMELAKSWPNPDKNHPWNSLGLCQQDADKRKQSNN